jgi:hypothetical protein
MEHMNTTLVQKLEMLFAKNAASHPKLEAMSLNELLYHAVVESRDDRGLMRDGALQGV